MADTGRWPCISPLSSRSWGISDLAELDLTLFDSAKGVVTVAGRYGHCDMAKTFLTFPLATQRHTVT